MCKSSSGYTLIELLVYIGVFALVAVGLTTTFVAVTRVQTEQTSDVEIDQQSAFLLSRLQDYIANASLIDIPVSAPTSTLRLRVPAHTSDPTVITVTGGVVYVAQGAGTPQPLTSNKVSVSNLTFTRQANPGSHDSVSLSFRMSPVGSILANAIAEAFQLSVERVSAASFDSDLVPSSTNLNLGVTGNTWTSVNNVIYFSGTKVGVNNNVPVQPLDVSGNAVVRGDVGIGNTSPSALLDLKSLVAGTHPANTTLAVFRDFYNNGANGQQLWMNAEGAAGTLVDINLTNDWGKLTFGAGGTGQTARDDLEISGGNLGLGIGTSSPRAKFEVNGNIINTTAYNANANLGSYDVGVGSVGASTVYAYTALCANNGLGDCTSSGGIVIGRQNSTAATNIPTAGATFFNNGGNVGIGLTAPTRAKVEESGFVGNTTAIFGAGTTGLGFIEGWPGIGFNSYFNGGQKSISAGFTGSIWVSPNDGHFEVRTGTTNTTAADQTTAETTQLSLSNAGTLTIGGGTGKVNVGTVDPVYTINGDKFATYDPGMTGQKEETTGVAELSCGKGALSADCSAALDVSGPKGSDLWLFGQVTNLARNFQNLVVLLTPSFDGRAWYTKDASGMKVIIHGDHAGEVSYRLSAPRFDAAEWPNASHDSAAGFIINN